MKSKKYLLLFVSVLFSGFMFANDGNTPDDAKIIDNVAGYGGTEAFVYSKADHNVYARNNKGEYERYGVYPEVTSLKVAGGGETEIEYIATVESTGKNPYINTNYIPKANTRIVLDVDIANSTAKNWMAVFGARQGGWTSHAFVLFARAWGNQTGCYNRTGDEHAADSDIPRDQRMTIDAYEKTCTFTLNGESTPTLTITTKEESTVEDCTNNLYLFDTNTAGAGGNQRDNSFVYMKLYGCKIYEGETLVRDFVPIVDSEGNGGLKDKVTGVVILSATSDNFELSPDGVVAAADAGTTVYEGKRVVLKSDGHEYKYTGSEWVDCGEAFEDITETNYQNMNNWTCRWGYAETFGHIENTNGNDNFFNPYKGEGNWEPYQCKVTNLTNGDDYRVSFDFTSNGWNSWSSYTAMPFFVTGNEEFGRELVPSAVNSEVLGLTKLPQAAVTDQHHSFMFTADRDFAVLAIQFGVGDDNKEFFFHFDNLLIEHANYPDKYPTLDPYSFLDFTATRYDKNGVGYMAVDGGNGYSDGETWTKICDNRADTKFCGNLDQAWFVIKPETPVALKQYSLLTGADTYTYRNRNPNGWVIQGSNDGKVWTEIVNVEQTSELGRANNHEYVFEVNSSTHYKYFKFIARKCWTAVQLAEVWINEQAHTWGEPVTTPATCASYGNSVYTCSDCGAKKTTWIPATRNHNYVSGTCSVCGETPKVVTFLHDGQRDGALDTYTVKFKYANGVDKDVDMFGAGWNNVGFDDSGWNDLLMPLAGGDSYKGDIFESTLYYNSVWYGTYNTFWMRRTFNLTEADITNDMQLVFKTFHDDDIKVYLNGNLVKEQNGWTDYANKSVEKWDSWTIDAPASKLRVGENVLAVYVEQNFGGAFLDYSLTATYPDVNRTLTNGYATFSAVKDYAITTDGVKAYRAVASATPGYIRLEEVGTDIPANTGVVLFGEGKDNVTLTVTTGAAAVGSNMLHANVVDYALPAESDGCKNYTLGLDPENSSVCVFRPSNGDGLLAAGKAYLAVPNGGGAKYGITFGDETGINDELRVNSDASAPIFNLQGQRVNSSYKGVVVVGGKKFTVK